MENKLETITVQFLEECTFTNNIANTLKSLDEITSIENKIRELINNASNGDTREMLENMLNDWQEHSKEYLKDISLICNEIKEKGYSIFYDPDPNRKLDENLVAKYGEEFTRKLYLEINQNLIKLIRAVAAYNLYIKNSKKQGLEIKDIDILEKKKEINELYKKTFNKETNFYEFEINEELDLRKYLPVNGDKSKLDEETEHFLEECSYTNNIDASFDSLKEITKKEQEIIDFVKTLDDKELETKFNSMLYDYQKHSKIYIADCLRIQSDLSKKGHVLYSMDKKPREYLLNLIRVIARYNLYIKRANELGISVARDKIEEWKKSINILYQKVFGEEKEFYELKNNKELNLSFYVPDIAPVKEEVKSDSKQEDDGLINIGDMLNNSNIEDKEEQQDINLTDYMFNNEPKVKELRKDTLEKGIPVIQVGNDTEKDNILKNASIPSKPFNLKKKEEKVIEIPSFMDMASEYPIAAEIKIKNAFDCCYLTPYVGLLGDTPRAPLYARDAKRYVLTYYVLFDNMKLGSATDSEQLSILLGRGGKVISVRTLDYFYDINDIEIIGREKHYGKSR